MITSYQLISVTKIFATKKPPEREVWLEIGSFMPSKNPPLQTEGIISCDCA